MPFSGQVAMMNSFSNVKQLLFCNFAKLCFHFQQLLASFGQFQPILANFDHFLGMSGSDCLDASDMAHILCIINCLMSMSCFAELRR